MLEPFEVRFLAGRRLPNLWVIDLSKNDDKLITPQKYFTVANSEDRLFIPEEYAPLYTLLVPSSPKDARFPPLRWGCEGRMARITFELGAPFGLDQKRGYRTC
jgi:hypothetical protein